MGIGLARRVEAVNFSIIFKITDLLHSRRYDEAPSKGALCLESP